MSSPFLYKRSRLWWIGWRDEKGVQHGESLKTGDAVKASILRDEWIKKLGAAEEGVPNDTALWETVKTDFLKGYKEGSRTWTIHKHTLSLFESFANPVEISVTYNIAKAFRDHLQAKDSPRGGTFKPSTINIHVRNLHTFFNEAKRLNYVTKNPFDEVKQIPDTKRKPRYLTKEEIGNLVAEAEMSWDKPKILMLYLFLYTGVRPGELINLKWSAIDLGRKIFYLHGSETWEPKDREEHAIGLHPELEKRLKKHPKTSEYVFPGMKGGKRCQFSMVRLFNRLYNRAGVTASGLKILRHTFATHCGLPTKTKQRVLGHSSITTTMIYDHVTPEDLAGIRKISYI